MSRVDPVDSRVRLAIVQWPPDAQRGSITTFCAEHGISRETFYAIRKRAAEDGPTAALEPRSRRPRSSPSKVIDEVVQRAVGVRAALEASGLDHGPISVHEKMRSLGLEPVPAVSSLARIFRDAGVARVEPRKKPRASFRRFVYPAPNACWQLDATEYVLTGGRKCVIFQLIDDHSRFAVASHVSWGVTSEGAIAVVSKGIQAHGVPQRLLSDNGAALNPSRRGVLGQLVVYLRSLGVEPITGKPYKPTTQGKNERFHQTLFRWLDKQPLAATLEQLQGQVDAFDLIYNTERPHQGLPGRVTPTRAWAATPVAEPPKPVPQAAAPAGDEGIRMTRIHDNGTVYARGAKFQVSRTLAGAIAYRVEEDDRLCARRSGGPARAGPGRSTRRHHQAVAFNLGGSDDGRVVLAMPRRVNQVGEKRWPLRIGWICLAVVSLGILGFGVVIVIVPVAANALLYRADGLASIGLGLLGGLIALIPYRRRERWAWVALWFYPVFWGIHLVYGLPPGTDHVHQIVFIALSLLGLLLPVRAFFSPRRTVAG